MAFHAFHFSSFPPRTPGIAWSALRGIAAAKRVSEDLSAPEDPGLFDAAVKTFLNSVAAIWIRSMTNWGREHRSRVLDSIGVGCNLRHPARLRSCQDRTANISTGRTEYRDHPATRTLGVTRERLQRVRSWLWHNSKSVSILLSNSRTLPLAMPAAPRPLEEESSRPRRSCRSTITDELPEEAATRV